MTGQPVGLDIASMLIAGGADVNRFGRDPDGCTPLTMAGQEGEEMIARFLLERRADPSLGKDNGSTPLFKALHAHIKKELLDKMRAELTILGFVAFSATILLQVDT